MPKLLEKEQDVWHLAFSSVYILLVIILTIFLAYQGKYVAKISLFDFFLLFLADFRMVRLFTYDSVTGFIRRYLGKFTGGPQRTLADLLDCPWCTGVWMALIAVFIYFVIPYSWIFILILAIAGLGSFIQIVIWKIGLEEKD